MRRQTDENRLNDASDKKKNPTSRMETERNTQKKLTNERKNSLYPAISFQWRFQPFSTLLLKQRRNLMPICIRKMEKMESYKGKKYHKRFATCRPSPSYRLVMVAEYAPHPSPSLGGVGHFGCCTSSSLFLRAITSTALE